ncbi:TPA: nucleotidyl transferase AbiEii/AbiGii toxin family protein [Legionella pneumophila]|nr:nucleotidyl transferase AbiEii/AbiGii toxin family protein [Legionella pneumophila]
MLNSAELKELIAATQAHIRLRASVIEKDYYVTQVIHALSNVENEYFRLVFCGGTCLAKAHQIVSRMSEDVDFKIQPKQIEIPFSKTRLLKELKQFRTYIQSQLNLAGLSASEPIVRNEGRYSRIDLTYPSSFETNEGLRPHILLEFTLSDVRRDVVDLPVKTLIEANLKSVVLLPPRLTSCVTVDETAIEKWVGLTRRIIAIERGYHADDKSLIRHVYDLNAIEQADKIHDIFFTLAKDIVINDAKQFKNQHPEYSINPSDEIKQSLALLRTKPEWSERYQEFVETMVFDNRTVLEYDKAIIIIEQISNKIINILIQ